MRRQIVISCTEGNLWERVEEASKRTGMKRSTIAREVLELYLDKWLEVQDAKIEVLKKQGIALAASSSESSEDKRLSGSQRTQRKRRAK